MRRTALSSPAVLALSTAALIAITSGATALVVLTGASTFDPLDDGLIPRPPAGVASPLRVVLLPVVRTPRVRPVLGDDAGTAPGTGRPGLTALPGFRLAGDLFISMLPGTGGAGFAPQVPGLSDSGGAAASEGDTPASDGPAVDASADPGFGDPGPAGDRPGVVPPAALPFPDAPPPILTAPAVVTPGPVQRPVPVKRSPKKPAGPTVAPTEPRLVTSVPFVEDDRKSAARRAAERVARERAGRGAAQQAAAADRAKNAAADRAKNAAADRAKNAAAAPVARPESARRPTPAGGSTRSTDDTPRTSATQERVATVPDARSRPDDVGVTGAPGRDAPPERAGQKAEANEAAQKATRQATDVAQKVTTKKDKDDGKGEGR